MLNDPMTEAWQTKTDYERYEQNWIAPKQHLQIPTQDGYQHQPWQSGDSRDFVSDVHPEDSWN